MVRPSQWHGDVFHPSPCAGEARATPAGIPLAGRVAAGAPVEAIENVESLSLTSCFGSSDDLFALEVTGNSMIDEDILEGDYVICRRTRIAENGQLVIAIVDDENATLKRFFKEPDRARLQPANDDYQPIYCDNCRIEAVVIGLVRRL
jgi:repressor LexA